MQKDRGLRRGTSPGVVVLAAFLASPGWNPAYGCSICRCGDPTYNALGSDGVVQSGLRVAMDWDRMEKSQGGADERESLTEERATALVAYGPSERLGLFIRVPFSARELVSHEDGGSERVSTSGLADPEIYGQLRLWTSRFEGDVGTRASVFLLAGVKTDWGDNNERQHGERLDEHVQPGTGSVDEFVGLAGSYQLNPSSALVASVQYRYTGRNDFGYSYGNVGLANVAFDHRLSDRWDAVVEANYRNAARDETDFAGTRDPDTGGSITYLTPRVLFSAGRGWVLRGSAQIPLYQSGLSGKQQEKAVLNFGATYLFGRQRLDSSP